MVRNIAVAVFVAVVLMVTIQEASTIKCYNCVKCGDPFDKEKHKNDLDNCPLGVCAKIKQKGDVHRVCGPENVCDAAKSTGGADSCDECKEDGCNGAVQHGAMAALVGLLISIVALL